MTKLTWEQEEILTLRDKVAELEEELLQLREQQKGEPWFPAEWKLTRAERKALAAFLGAPRGRLTRSQLLEAIKLKDDPEVKMVDTVIFRLRPKIDPLGIKIITIWGEGFEIPTASREIIKRAIAAGSDAT